MKRVVFLLVAVLLGGGLIAVFAVAFGKDPNEIPKGIEGKQAPEFTMRDLVSGKMLTLADFKGKPTIMNFWASWCGPCRYEHPFLAWGAEQFPTAVPGLGVAFEDPAENAPKFLKENGAPFPQLFDERGQISVEYGLSGVPETYFIDHHGKILYKHIGAVSPDLLKDWVGKLKALQLADARP
ncbi:MAG: TlpA family protein disulfide reductase [Myxococcaceae bacterium]